MKSCTPTQTDFAFTQTANFKLKKSDHRLQGEPQVLTRDQAIGTYDAAREQAGAALTNKSTSQILRESFAEGSQSSFEIPDKIIKARLDRYIDRQVLKTVKTSREVTGISPPLPKHSSTQEQSTPVGVPEENLILKETFSDQQATLAEQKDTSKHQETLLASSQKKLYSSCDSRGDEVQQAQEQLMIHIYPSQASQRNRGQSQPESDVQGGHHTLESTSSLNAHQHQFAQGHPELTLADVRKMLPLATACKVNLQREIKAFQARQKSYRNYMIIHMDPVISDIKNKTTRSFLHSQRRLQSLYGTHHLARQAETQISSRENPQSQLLYSNMEKAAQGAEEAHNLTHGSQMVRSFSQQDRSAIGESSDMVNSQTKAQLQSRMAGLNQLPSNRSSFAPNASFVPESPSPLLAYRQETSELAQICQYTEYGASNGNSPQEKSKNSIVTIQQQQSRKSFAGSQDRHLQSSGQDCNFSEENSSKKGATVAQGPQSLYQLTIKSRRKKGLFNSFLSRKSDDDLIGVTNQERPYSPGQSKEKDKATQPRQSQNQLRKSAQNFLIRPTSVQNGFCTVGQRKLIQEMRSQSRLGEVEGEQSLLKDFQGVSSKAAPASTQNAELIVRPLTSNASKGSYTRSSQAEYQAKSRQQKRFFRSSYGRVADQESVFSNRRNSPNEIFTLRQNEFSQFQLMSKETDDDAVKIIGIMPSESPMLPAQAISDVELDQKSIYSNGDQSVFNVREQGIQAKDGNDSVTTPSLLNGFSLTHAQVSNKQTCKLNSRPKGATFLKITSKQFNMDMERHRQLPAPAQPQHQSAAAPSRGMQTGASFEPAAKKAYNMFRSQKAATMSQPLLAQGRAKSFGQTHKAQAKRQQCMSNCISVARIGAPSQKGTSSFAGSSLLKASKKDVYSSQRSQTTLAMLADTKTEAAGTHSRTTHVLTANLQLQQKPSAGKSTLQNTTNWLSGILSLGNQEQSRQVELSTEHKKESLYEPEYPALTQLISQDSQAENELKVQENSQPSSRSSVSRESIIPQVTNPSAKELVKLQANDYMLTLVNKESASDVKRVNAVKKSVSMVSSAVQSSVGFKTSITGDPAKRPLEVSGSAGQSTSRNEDSINADLPILQPIIQHANSHQLMPPQPKSTLKLASFNFDQHLAEIAFNRDSGSVDPMHVNMQSQGIDSTIKLPESNAMTPPKFSDLQAQEESAEILAQVDALKALGRGHSQNEDIFTHFNTSYIKELDESSHNLIPYPQSNKNQGIASKAPTMVSIVVNSEAEQAAQFAPVSFAAPPAAQTSGPNKAYAKLSTIQTQAIERQGSSQHSPKFNTQPSQQSGKSASRKDGIPSLTQLICDMRQDRVSSKGRRTNTKDSHQSSIHGKVALSSVVENEYLQGTALKIAVPKQTTQLHHTSKQQTGRGGLIVKGKHKIFAGSFNVASLKSSTSQQYETN